MDKSLEQTLELTKSTISFIILHYNNLVDTIECINSIKKSCNNENYNIIIVANSNNDIKELKELTNDLIVNETNLGFAKANNIGCEYAIKNYQPDYLCVINNDTLINQSNFIDLIKQLDDKYHFDMLGPKILTDNKFSCNPFPGYKSIEEIKQAINKANKLIKIYQNKLLRLMLEIYLKLKPKVIKNLQAPIPTNGIAEEVGVALHGCAIIFSKKYYQKYNDVFYNDTFLYHEEEFLYFRMLKDNLISVYSPKIEIFHKEEGSVNKQFKNEKYKKLVFKQQEIIKSLTKLLSYIEQNE